MITEALIANGNKPVRIEATALYIDGEEFQHPIAEGSISVTRLGKSKRHNLLTLTLVVGEVTFPCSESR